MLNTLKSRKGFSLIELMIVVVIIGILAAIAIPRFTSLTADSQQSEAYGILAQICNLQDVQEQRTGSHAANLDNLRGWTEPEARYFEFETAAGEPAAGEDPATGHTATAIVRDDAPNAVQGVLRDCVSRTMTLTDGTVVND